MIADQLIRKFKGITSVRRFVTNLLSSLRPARSGGLHLSSSSIWFLINRVKQIGTYGNLLELGKSRLESRAIPLEYAEPSGDKFTSVQRGNHNEGLTSDQLNLKIRRLLSNWLKGWQTTNESRPLDSAVHRLLSRWLGRRVPSVQIHSGDLSNRLLNKYHADAMTIGRDIFIRTDKFNLHSAPGLALLGHELTHASQEHTGSTDPIGPSPVRQEQVALENERLVLLHARPHLGQGGFPYVPHGPGSVPWSQSNSKSGPVTPMFADASRNVAEPEPAISAPTSPMGISDTDMDRVKEAVRRDLMDKIKEDFERGS